jgi:transposase
MRVVIIDAWFMGKTRKRWSVAEKRRIVELTLEPGASVAHVALAEGVNANQVFQWRRAFHSGDLQSGGSTALLPVVVSEAASSTVAEFEATPEITQAVSMEAYATQPSGAIHIELPGCATISVERGADRALLRTILESLSR